MDRVMELLNVQRNGLQRVKGVKSALFLRRSSSVEILDLRELPSQFVETRIEYVPRKTQIKDALKGGQAVPGAQITERQSLVINTRCTSPRSTATGRKT